MKLSCVGNKLTVEVDLANKGSYWDLNDPFLDGTVGARSEVGNHRFDNLKVTAL
ncbi:hypothetical protein [Paenibacillus sp. URB8-2]|uniref:hypothetical protein n=1 Tax=Paenibacillus sp. URB8-2 TaxID=2741301 RepID=UPI0015B9ABE9|nr:hypothetical protein [Paenibacillus sp. URB8-2]BCG57679.1 hypothetical protein PUR_11040 [Paenibacillus sp. URB8-2]